MPFGNEDEEISWNCWLRTVFAASGALITVVFIGITEAQSGVMLPQLKEADSFIHVTPDQETWIASFGILMAPISALLAGPFIDWFGRKRGLQYFYFNMGLGFAVIAFAQNVYHIYIGRIICGAGAGLELLSIIYIAEICTKKLRCDLFATVSALFSGGAALSCVVGAIMPWTLASLIFSIICLVLFILLFFIPESPPWLFKTGQEEACTESYKTLGRNTEQINRELKILKHVIKDDARHFKWKTFRKPTVWKPFLIMSTVFFLQCASGVFDVIYYAVDFVERMGTSYDPLVVTTILSVARFLSTATIGVYFRARFGRKPTLAISASGMTVGFVGAGIYEYVFRDVSVSERTFQWVPIVFLAIYLASGVFGMLALPWVMTGEVYPLKVRGTMMSATHFVGCTGMFVFIKGYYFCLNLLQIYGLLFAYAVPSFAAVLFAVFVLPETNNKSLFEIEQSFMPKKGKRDSTTSDTILHF